MSATPSPEIPAPAAIRTQRPFRVKLRGSILALMRLPNKRQVRGKVHQISITGGLLNVETPLDEKLQVELIFQLGEATIRERAEMLFPMWATQGWLQPFRFIELPEDRRNVLEAHLKSLVQQSQPLPPVAAAETAKAAEAGL